jgi:hypothetical protein
MIKCGACFSASLWCEGFYMVDYFDVFWNTHCRIHQWEFRVTWNRLGWFCGHASHVLRNTCLLMCTVTVLYSNDLLLTGLHSISSPMAQQAPVGQGLLIIEASGSYSDITIGRTPLVGWSARRRNSTWQHQRQKPMPPVWFEPAIPAGKRPQTHALDRAATGICCITLYTVYQEHFKQDGKRSQRINNHGADPRNLAV